MYVIVLARVVLDENKGILFSLKCCRVITDICKSSISTLIPINMISFRYIKFNLAHIHFCSSLSFLYPNHVFI